MYRLLFFILLMPLYGSAQLQVANFFSGNMVLQRDRPIAVWGRALPACQVEVQLGTVKKTVKVKKDSSWILWLPRQKASSHPLSLQISCGDTAVRFDNLLIGDVWLCIGQSNMEWPMEKELHFAEEKANSHQPLLRFYNPVYAGKNIYGTAFPDSVIQRLTTEKFYTGSWQSCDSASFRTMSAVAYYFAKAITAKIKVPVGMINLSVGGAPLETFIDKDVLVNSQSFASKVKGNWIYNESLPVWVRQRATQNIGNNPLAPGDEAGPNHAFKPGFAYDAGIEMLTRMPVKGILCYQGESNAQESARVYEYAALSQLLVNDYRQKWKQPQLPFYFVQLSSIDTVNYKGHLWHLFRNEQRKMLQLIPGSGMAVCSDIGARHDVHPVNKKEVGERLARWALHKTYLAEIIPSGPLPVQAIYKKGKVFVSFQYAAKGLAASDGSTIRGFSTDGINEAKAVFGDQGIYIFTATKPAIIYYGWKPFSDGNLVNSVNLPASTFKVYVQ